jgi:hypothetical protein
MSVAIAFQSIPNITIPLYKKDFWLNVQSDKAYISWYNVMKDRRQKGSKKRKSKIMVYDNKSWCQVYYESRKFFF